MALIIFFLLHQVLRKPLGCIAFPFAGLAPCSSILLPDRISLIIFQTGPMIPLIFSLPLFFSFGLPLLLLVLFTFIRFRHFVYLLMCRCSEFDVLAVPIRNAAGSTLCATAADLMCLLCSAVSVGLYDCHTVSHQIDYCMLVPNRIKCRICTVGDRVEDVVDYPDWIIASSVTDQSGWWAGCGRLFSLIVVCCRRLAMLSQGKDHLSVTTHLLVIRQRFSAKMNYKIRSTADGRSVA